MFAEVESARRQRKWLGGSGRLTDKKKNHYLLGAEEIDIIAMILYYTHVKGDMQRNSCIGKGKKNVSRLGKKYDPRIRVKLRKICNVK